MLHRNSINTWCLIKNDLLEFLPKVTLVWGIKSFEQWLVTAWMVTGVWVTNTIARASPSGSCIQVVPGPTWPRQQVNNTYILVFLNYGQTSPVLVEMYNSTEEQKLCNSFCICKRCFYCIFMCILSMYNLINFAVGTASGCPDSPPRVLINMSRCINCSETQKLL